MAEPSYPTDLHDCGSDAEELERLDAAMDETPRGALVVSAIAVGLLLIGWLGLYFLVFLPRGSVG
jgi:cytochrome c oxidase subunit IIa family protein